jgi:hypothetical protein
MLSGKNIFVVSLCCFMVMRSNELHSTRNAWQKKE